MKKVFLVDDEKSIVNWLENSVNWEEYGCTVYSSSTHAQTALEELKREKVDILITDIAMPDMNGLTLIKMVKEFQPHIHIIIISAHSDFSYAKEAVRLGAEDYILKPLDKVELEEALRRITFSMNQKLPQDDFKLFQNNMLQRWVKGLDNTDDFREQAEIAGLDIEKQHYSVFIVHTQDLHKDVLIQVFQQCCEFMQSKSEGLFLDSLTDIAGVLSKNETENKIVLTQLLKLLRTRFGNNIHITLGKTAYHYLQVRLSYESAIFFRFAGLFTKDEVFLAHERPSPAALLESSTYRKLQLQLEEKNMTKALDSALEIASTLEKRHDIVAAREQALFIALSFLEANEIILTTNEAENIYAIAEEYRRRPPAMWLMKFLSVIKKHHDQQFHALHPYVLKMRTWVTEEYSNPDLNLSTLADKLKVTSVYLGQLFYSQTGSYFNDYLTDIRLKEACNLLTTTSTRIGDIAKQVGFSSQSYLNRVFRKKYHLTPLEYRQLPH